MFLTVRRRMAAFVRVQIISVVNILETQFTCRGQTHGLRELSICRLENSGEFNRVACFGLRETMPNKSGGKI